MLAERDLLAIRRDESDQLIDLTPRLRSRIRRAAVREGLALLSSAHASLSLVVATGGTATLDRSLFSGKLALPVCRGELSLEQGTAVVAAVAGGPHSRGLLLELVAID